MCPHVVPRYFFTDIGFHWNNGAPAVWPVSEGGSQITHGGFWGTVFWLHWTGCKNVLCTAGEGSFTTDCNRAGQFINVISIPWCNTRYHHKLCFAGFKGRITVKWCNLPDGSSCSTICLYPLGPCPHCIFFFWQKTAGWELGERWDEVYDWGLTWWFNATFTAVWHTQLTTGLQHVGWWKHRLLFLCYDGRNKLLLRFLSYQGDETRLIQYMMGCLKKSDGENTSTFLKSS